LGGKGKKYPSLISIPISYLYLSTKIGGITGRVLLLFNSDEKIGTEFSGFLVYQ
jgi:hypothetical protein